MTKTTVALLVIAFAMAHARESAAQDVSWIRQFGTVRFDSADSIATDADHAYAAGRVGFEQALFGQVSAGSVDTFVRKYEAEGGEVWTRQFGTSGFDGFPTIAVHASAVYVIGLTEGAFPGQVSAGGDDVFIRRYDVDGNEQWTRQLGTSGHEFVLDVAAHAGGVDVFGVTTGVFPGQAGAGGTDFFLARLDADANLLWVRQFGTSGNDPAIFTLGGVAVDATGVYVGSTVSSALPEQAALGGADAFLRKYDLAGNELWTTQFGTACGDILSGVAVHAGGVYVTGSTTGRMSDPFFERCTNPPSPNNNFGDVPTAFVQKRAADGAVAWTRQYEGSSGPTGFSLGIKLAVDGSGVYVASEALRPRDPDAMSPACPIDGPHEDIHVRRYGLDGAEGWTRLIGSTQLDVPSDIDTNADGVYVAAVTLCQLGEEPNAGSADAVVIKLTAEP